MVKAARHSGVSLASLCFETEEGEDRSLLVWKHMNSKAVYSPYFFTIALDALATAVT